MSDLASILPNLSIGVVSICALAYITIRFLQALDARADKHEKAMAERETSMRNLETSVRQTLTEHLSKASIALHENAKVFDRVVRVLDKNV